MKYIKITLIIILLILLLNCKNDTRLQGTFSNNSVENFSIGTMTSIDEVFFENNTFRHYMKTIYPDGEENELEQTFKIKIIKRNSKGGIFYAIYYGIPDEYFDDPIFRYEYKYTFNGNELLLVWEGIEYNYIRGRPPIENLSNLSSINNQPIKNTNWHNVEQVDGFGDSYGIKILFGDFLSLNNTLTISISDRSIDFRIKEGNRDVRLNNAYALIRTNNEKIALSTLEGYSKNILAIGNKGIENNIATNVALYNADRIIYKEEFLKFLKEGNEFKILFQMLGDNNSSYLFDIKYNKDEFLKLYEEMIKSYK